MVVTGFVCFFKSKKNGLNLYCYCNNNPVIFIDLNWNTPITFFLLFLLGSLISVTVLSLSTPNAETTGPSFEKLSFLIGVKNAITIISIGANSGRKDLYLNDDESRSIYFSGFSVGFSIALKKDIKKF